MKQISPLLRAQLEEPHKVRFWGSEYTVTPRVCPTVFGNGSQLVAFQPLDTRPEYYIVFVDSGWALDNFASTPRPCLVDHYDDICTAIEAEYGSADDYQKGGGCEGEEDPGWPVPSFDSGVQWCELEMPEDSTDKPTAESEAKR